MIFLHALGQCLIRSSVATIGPRAELGFALATRLIAERGRRLSRRYLTALFWPDVEEQRAAHSLSEALHRLRARGLPIETDPTQAVWIDRDAATIDVERIPEMRAADLLRCDFTVLPGFEPRGAPALRDWADDFRHHLTLQAVRNLAIPIANAERDGEWEVALALAEHTLRLDGEDPVALDARARAAQALRGRTSPRTNEHHQVRVPPETVRETPPSRCGLRSESGRSEMHDGVFVGRQDELSILTDAWSQAVSGRGRHVALIGESGIGKSKLLHEFTSRARRTGGVVAEVSCDPPDHAMPMSALMRLVPRLRRLPGAAGCSPELLPYLDRLTEYAVGRGQLPDTADVLHLAACVERAVEELVDAVADEQALVLAVDNAQWMDADSARVIDMLVQRAMSRPILIVLVSCETLPSSTSGRCSGVIPVRLQPLADDAARALISSAVKNGTRETSESVINWMVRAGEGHPLWLAELAQHWITTGKEFSVPPSLAALLRDRVSSLASLERRVLQVVALLAHGATVARTRKVLNVSDAELLDAIDSLGTAGLLAVNRIATATDSPELICRHDAIADAALSQLSPPAKVLLHQQIALVLDDESQRSGSAELLWQRTTHWTAGHRSDRFVDLGLECVNHLVEIGLVDAATATCRDVAARCGRPADAQRVNLSLAEIYHLTHRWQDFASVIASTPRLPGTHDELEVLILDADWQQRRDCRSTLEATLACAGAATASAAHRIAAATLAVKIATNLGELGAIEQASSCVRGLIGAGCQTADALMFEMIHAAVDGSGDTAARHARALLQQLARSACEGRLRLLLNCAVALSRGGAVDEANEVCEQVYALAPHSGLPRLSLDACRRGALMMLDHGRFEEGRAWIERIGCTTADVLSPVQKGPIEVMRAKLALFDGDSQMALDILAPLSERVRGDPMPMFDAAVLAVRVIAQIQQRCAPPKVARDVKSLEALEESLAPLGGQDYEAVALAAGSAYIGQEQEARLMFNRYLSSGRRDPYPLPAAFDSMLEELLGAVRG